MLDDERGPMDAGVRRCLADEQRAAAEQRRGQKADYGSNRRRPFKLSEASPAPIIRIPTIRSPTALPAGL